MMNTILSLVAILTLNTGDINEENSRKKEARIISEMLENMEVPTYLENRMEFAKTISIYTLEGKLLHEFSEDNFDARAMRNTDLLIEDASSKIFIKFRN